MGKKKVVAGFEGPGQKSILWLTIERHPQELKALIRKSLDSRGWNVFEVDYESIEKLDELPLETVSGVLLAPAREVPHRALVRLESCSLLQIWSSGYDKFNLVDARRTGLTVANNHGANAVAVAEHTLLLMLGVSRRAPEMHERVVRGNWAGNDHGMGSFSLSGKTLGIIGMGRIGSLVASRAISFGMRVIFTDPNVQKSPGNLGARRVEWEELLQESDYISLHLHQNEQTRNMLNTEAFAKMSKRPFIINASRAELVDRGALLNALSSGQIKGLGIDAHYFEPTSADDQLWEFPSIFASPHVAGSTFDSYVSTIEACLDNLAAAMSGGTPRGIIL